MSLTFFPLRQSRESSVGLIRTRRWPRRGADSLVLLDLSAIMTVERITSSSGAFFPGAGQDQPEWLYFLTAPHIVTMSSLQGMSQHETD